MKSNELLTAALQCLKQQCTSAFSIRST